MKKILLIVCLTIGLHYIVKAQSKIKDGSVPGSSIPNADAILELESSNKGFLLPRVALTATTSATPTTSHVAGITVYNTATAGSGSTAVQPGYYYNDGTQWIRLAGAESYKEPWKEQGSDNLAETNTQNIYQMGKVAIGANLGNSTLSVTGSFSLPIKQITADYTVTENDYTLVCRHTAAITVSLPDPATCSGRIYCIINNGSDKVTTNYAFEVSTNTTQSFIPKSGMGISVSYPNFGQKYTLQSDGTQWVLISLG